MTTIDYFEPAIAGVRPCALQFCSGTVEDHSGLCRSCLPLFGRYDHVVSNPATAEWDPGWTVEKLASGDTTGAPPSKECLTIS